MNEHNLYERETLALGQENSLSKLAAYIPDNASVLDVGCATGRLGEYLQNHTACIVDAIETDPASAHIARAYYRSLYSINIEAEDAFSVIAHEYDVIVLADVLEHLRYPEWVLQQLSKKLTPQGKFLISVPNVGHIGVMLQLLQGTFVYHPQGLLDKTHLRFFSRQNLAQFFADAQMQQWRLLDRVLIGIQGTEFASSLLHGISPAWLAVFPTVPEGNTYQFLLEASPTALLKRLPPEQEMIDCSSSSVKSLSIPLPAQAEAHENTAIDTLLQGNCALLDMPCINNGIYIHVTLHYCTTENPLEYRALTQVCYLHEQLFFLTFPLPDNITKLRFDPADIAGIMRLKQCQLHDASHTPVWALTQQSEIVEKSMGLVIAWSADHAAILEMSDADPWFVLPVSLEGLAVAKSFVVHFSWPHTHDYWLLEAHCRDQNQQVQKDLQIQQEVNNDEFNGDYQQLYAQTMSIKATFKQLMLLIRKKLCC